MCLIVDTNVLVNVFGHDGSADRLYADVRKWLLGRDGGLVVGGSRFVAEFMRVGAAVEFARTLEQAGRFHRRLDANVDAEEKRVRAKLKLRSDDPHVIALARESGARALCSEDANLIWDFQRRDVVPDTQGKICTAITKTGGRRMVRSGALHHSPGCPRR